MVVLFVTVKFRKYPAEKTLFELPKKAELPKNKTVEQKYYVVDRKNEDPVKYGRGEGHYAIGEKVLKNRSLEKKYRKTRAGKNHQDDDCLKDAVYFPTRL